MQKEIERSRWDTFFNEFSERNQMRPTRLEIIGRADEVASDFWLEDGVPLSGVSLEPEGDGAPSVQIMLDGNAAQDTRHLTHNVTGVRRVRCGTGENGRDDSLEIEDQDGAMTILRFE